jgi:primary-amine oxidase
VSLFQCPGGGFRIEFSHASAFFLYAFSLSFFTGEYPAQRTDEDGLAKWVEENRRVANTDIVIWHTFGITHIVRCEDYPIMPVEYTGFVLKPFNFFDRNPAIDHLPIVKDGVSKMSKL